MKKTKSRMVDIFSYCLMPNHYHLLIKEIRESGLRKLIGNLQNSYAKYFNTKKKRNGSLFQEMFKIVMVENDEQFIHVSRYIHLNPLTSYIISKQEDLENYTWSSFPIYLGIKNSCFLDTNFLLNYYSNKEKLKSFTLDQVDYQRKIHDLEYLAIEKY